MTTPVAAAYTRQMPGYGENQPGRSAASGLTRLVPQPHLLSSAVLPHARPVLPPRCGRAGLLRCGSTPSSPRGSRNVPHATCRREFAAGVAGRNTGPVRDALLEWKTRREGGRKLRR